MEGWPRSGARKNTSLNSGKRKTQVGGQVQVRCPGPRVRTRVLRFPGGAQRLTSAGRPSKGAAEGRQTLIAPIHVAHELIRFSKGSVEALQASMTLVQMAQGQNWMLAGPAPAAVSSETARTDSEGGGRALGLTTCYDVLFFLYERPTVWFR